MQSEVGQGWKNDVDTGVSIHSTVAPCVSSGQTVSGSGLFAPIVTSTNVLIIRFHVFNCIILNSVGVISLNLMSICIFIYGYQLYQPAAKSDGDAVSTIVLLNQKWHETLILLIMEYANFQFFNVSFTPSQSFMFEFREPCTASHFTPGVCQLYMFGFAQKAASIRTAGTLSLHPGCTSLFCAIGAP